MMKRAIVAVMGLLAVAAWAEQPAEADFRDFTDRQGRVIDARILGSRADGSVQIERRGGQKAWVKPDIFCKADETYIKGWLSVDSFLSSRRLGLTLELKEKKAYNEYEEAEYELTFNNTSDEPIEINGIDFLCKVQRKEESRMDQVSQNEVVWGFWENGLKFKLKPGKLTHILQGPLILDEEGRDERIKGVWVRIKGPVFVGKNVYREVFLPEKLYEERSWAEVRETARDDLLNPYRPKKAEATRTAGAKPSDVNEYRRWFHEIWSEGNFYMASRPVKMEEAKKSYEELKAFYDALYESKRGENARLVAKLAYKVRDYKGTVEWYEISLKGEGNEASLRELSALYSSGIRDITNGDRAIELAKILVTKDEQNYWDLDLLARGYARSGDFQRAIETQKKVIELVEKKGLKDHKIRSLMTGLSCMNRGSHITINHRTFSDEHDVVTGIEE